MQLIYSPQSERDLEEIADFIAIDNPLRAVSFIREMKDSCKKLQEFPLIGIARPDLDKDSRMLVYQNYRIFYYATESKVIVDRFLPGSRDVDEVFENKKQKLPTKPGSKFTKPEGSKEP